MEKAAIHLQKCINATFKIPIGQSFSHDAQRNNLQWQKGWRGGGRDSGRTSLCVWLGLQGTFLPLSLSRWLRITGVTKYRCAQERGWGGTNQEKVLFMYSCWQQTPCQSQLHNYTQPPAVDSLSTHRDLGTVTAACYCPIFFFLLCSLLLASILLLPSHWPCNAESLQNDWLA